MVAVRNGGRGRGRGRGGRRRNKDRESPEQQAAKEKFNVWRESLKEM